MKALFERYAFPSLQVRCELISELLNPQGKGVGASTLQSLQSVDLILHVLREFEDENITHYDASIDPLRDMEIVNHEVLQYVRFPTKL